MLATSPSAGLRERATPSLRFFDPHEVQESQTIDQCRGLLSSALRAVAVGCDRPEYGPTTADRVRLLERRAKTDRVRVTSGLGILLDKLGGREKESTRRSLDLPDGKPGGLSCGAILKTAEVMP